MAEEKQEKGNKGGKASSKKKYARYKGANRREVNKIKRILQSNGEAYATEWAIKRMVTSYLSKLLAKKERK